MAWTGRRNDRDREAASGMGSPAGASGQRRGPSRRALLLGGLAGAAAGAVAVPLALRRDGSPREDEDPSRRQSLRNYPSAAREFPLNAGWVFGEYTAGSDRPGYNETHLTGVTLPHCVTRLSWQKWDPSAWQRVWIYRRTFDGTGLLNGRVLADFDGVMVNATVLINGETVTTHMGGYLPFSAELTGYLRPGDNVLAVIVDGRCGPVPPEDVPGDPASIDFLQPAGIYRDVRLRVVPGTYLADVFAQPVSVLTAQRGVSIQCTIEAAAAPNAPVRITAELSGPARKGDIRTIATTACTLDQARAGRTATALALTGLGDISLWSPASPALYTLTTTVSVPDAGTHSVRQRIGFREASFRTDGFFLNGERLKIFGLNRHQLFPYAGMAMPARIQRRDAEIIKKDFNCNMVRCSHYPQSPHFLDACDELGIMVWEEAPGWHHVGDAAWQDIVLANVRDMVIRDRSRPSVIMWGTRLNETRDYPGLYHRTRKIARDLDGSRPSTGAMDHYGTQFWDEDVFGYNDYHLTSLGHCRLRPPVPGVPYLVSEAVGVELPRPRHYRWTDPPALLARQAVLHAQAHDIAQADPRYAGLIAWAAFDYASLMGPGGQSVKCGRRRRRLPGGQAGRRHLPVPGRPEGPAGHRPRVLLGPGARISPAGPGSGRHARQQLRAGGGLRGRRARRHRPPGARHGNVRPSRVPADARGPDRVPHRPSRTAHRGLPRRQAGRGGADVVRPGRRPPRDDGRRHPDHRRRFRRHPGGVPGGRRLRQPAPVRVR